MASAEQLKALIKSHLEGDDSHFYAIAMQVAAHEAKLGHGKLAQELRNLIDEAKRNNRPVIVIQHGRGAIRDYCPPMNFKFVADKLCVW